MEYRFGEDSRNMRTWIRLWALLVVALVPLAQGHEDVDLRIERVLREVAARPGDPATRWTLADLYIQDNDAASALVQLQAVEALAPGSYGVDLLRARALLISGSQQEARLCLDRFLKSRPDHPVARLERARIEKRCGASTEALEDYRVLLSGTGALEPDWFAEASDLEWSTGDPRAAVAFLDQGLERLGKIPSLMEKAIEMEIRYGLLDHAIVRTEEMEKVASRAEPWMARRASLLAMAGRRGESVAAWRALLDHLELLPEEQQRAHAMVVARQKASQALSALEANTGVSP